MKKNVFGRKFKRDKNERQALFKSLISSLILKERIQTTEAKAKAIKGDVDKIITKVKKNQKTSFLGDLVVPHALEKLIKDIAPRFAKRSGGYTRIIRMGKRFGDDAMMVLMEWTEGPLPAEPKIKNQKSLRPELRARAKIKNTTQKLKVKKTRRSVAPRSGKGSSQ